MKHIKHVSRLKVRGQVMGADGGKMKSHEVLREPSRFGLYWVFVDFQDLRQGVLTSNLLLLPDLLRLQ